MPYLLALATASNLGGVGHLHRQPAEHAHRPRRGRRSRATPSSSLLVAAGRRRVPALDALVIAWLFRQAAAARAAAGARDRAAVPRLAAGGAGAGRAGRLRRRWRSPAVSLAGAAMTAAAGLILVARTPPRPVARPHRLVAAAVLRRPVRAGRRAGAVRRARARVRRGGAGHRARRRRRRRRVRRADRGGVEPGVERAVRDGRRRVGAGAWPIRRGATCCSPSPRPWPAT